MCARENCFANKKLTATHALHFQLWWPLPDTGKFLQKILKYLIQHCTVIGAICAMYHIASGIVSLVYYNLWSVHSDLQEKLSGFNFVTHYTTALLNSYFSTISERNKESVQLKKAGTVCQLWVYSNGGHKYKKGRRVTQGWHHFFCYSLCLKHREITFQRGLSKHLMQCVRCSIYINQFCFGTDKVHVESDS